MDTERREQARGEAALKHTLPLAGLASTNCPTTISSLRFGSTDRSAFVFICLFVAFNRAKWSALFTELKQILHPNKSEKKTTNGKKKTTASVEGCRGVCTKWGRKKRKTEYTEKRDEQKKIPCCQCCDKQILKQLVAETDRRVWRNQHDKEELQQLCVLLPTYWGQDWLKINWTLFKAHVESFPVISWPQITFGQIKPTVN